MSKIGNIPLALVGFWLSIVLPLSALCLVVLREVRDVKAGVALLETRQAREVIQKKGVALPSGTPAPSQALQQTVTRPATSSGVGK